VYPATLVSPVVRGARGLREILDPLAVKEQLDLLVQLDSRVLPETPDFLAHLDSPDQLASQEQAV
jgi:hypothetical protein